MKMFAILALTLVSSASFAGCKAGDIQFWPTEALGANNGDGGPQNVPWICKGGRYVEQYAPAFTRNSIPAGKCPEGLFQVITTGGDESGAPYVREEYVCHNGRMVNTNGTSRIQRHAAPRCIEGQITVFTTGGDESGAPYVREEYVCRNGRTIRTH